MPKEPLKQDTTKKDRLWLLPSENKNTLKAGLYLVPTPIGNMSDITVRALDVLSAADLILCEDTRVTKKLLSYYGITRKSLHVYNDHSDERARIAAKESVEAGKIVVLVSDAGTPLISDPGYKLARDALDQGLYVTALPGANAVLPALQLSAQPSDKFAFLGFFPQKQGARQAILSEWAHSGVPIVFYETAPRLLSALEAVQAALGGRDVAVVREISKLYEESRRGPVGDLIAHYTEQGAPKGEIVMVIGPSQHEWSDDDVHALMVRTLQSMRTKEAAAHVAGQTGRPKKDLYDLALDLSSAKKD